MNLVSLLGPLAFALLFFAGEQTAAFGLKRIIPLKIFKAGLIVGIMQSLNNDNTTTTDTSALDTKSNTDPSTDYLADYAETDFSNTANYDYSLTDYTDSNNYDYGTADGAQGPDTIMGTDSVTSGGFNSEVTNSDSLISSSDTTSDNVGTSSLDYGTPTFDNTDDYSLTDYTDTNNFDYRTADDTTTGTSAVTSGSSNSEPNLEASAYFDSLISSSDTTTNNVGTSSLGSTVGSFDNSDTFASTSSFDYGTPDSIGNTDDTGFVSNDYTVDVADSGNTFSDYGLTGTSSIDYPLSNSNLDNKSPSLSSSSTNFNNNIPESRDMSVSRNNGPIFVSDNFNNQPENINTRITNGIPDDPVSPIYDSRYATGISSEHNDFQNTPVVSDFIVPNPKFGLNDQNFVQPILTKPQPVINKVQAPRVPAPRIPAPINIQRARLINVIRNWQQSSYEIFDKSLGSRANSHARAIISQ